MMLNRNIGTIWGDNGTMTFEELYKNFFNERSFDGRSSENLSISKQEYITLKEKAEKFDAMSSQIETLRLENKELKDVLKQLQEDARHYKDLKEESEKYLKSLLRTQADFENFRKRTERDNQNYKLYALEKVLIKMINHYDDLKRVLKILDVKDIDESVRKGIEMIVRNYEKILEEEGVKPMKAEGELFDPYQHEVMTCLESDLPENIVIEELNQGYFFNDKVLRPAKVIISKNSKSCIKNQ